MENMSMLFMKVAKFYQFYQNYFLPVAEFIHIYLETFSLSNYDLGIKKTNCPKLLFKLGHCCLPSLIQQIGLKGEKGDFMISWIQISFEKIFAKQTCMISKLISVLLQSNMV